MKGIESGNRPGFALPLLLIVLVLGSVGGMMITSVANQQTGNSSVLQHAIRARQAAESGAAYMLGEFVRGYADGTLQIGDPDVEYTGSQLATWGPWRDSPLGNGNDLWWIESLRFDNTTVTMRVSGEARGAITTIEVIYTLDPSTISPFAVGVVGCEGATLAGSGDIDSYDSSAGPYNKGNNANSNASVTALHGDVELSGSSPIKGDLHVGGNLKLSGSTEITGKIMVTNNIRFEGNPRCPVNEVLARGSVTDPGSGWCPGARDLFKPFTPDVPDPAGPCDPLGVDRYINDEFEKARWEGTPQSGNFSAWQSAPIEFHENPTFTSDFNAGPNKIRFHTESVDQIYTNGIFVAGSSAEVRFTAPPNGETRHVRLFVDGDFTLEGAAQFIIEEGVALEVYVTGKVNMGAGFKNQNSAPTMEVNNNGVTSVIPTFAIYSSYEGANGVTVSGNTDVFASIYAPRADLRVTGSGALYGAVRGRNVTVDGGAGIHYDERLSDVQDVSPESDEEIRVTSWRDIY